MSHDNKRVLITVPLELLERLNQASEITGFRKSQIISIAVKRHLNDILDEFNLDN